MRRIALALAALLACAQAHASQSVWCRADDAVAKFEVAAAYGRSVGNGLANFGGELGIKLKGVPDAARKIKLENRHLSQNWFYLRDIMLMAQWAAEGGDISDPQIVLVIETRRAKRVETPYRGQYTLMIFAPGADVPRRAYGRVTCTAD